MRKSSDTPDYEKPGEEPRIEILKKGYLNGAEPIAVIRMHSKKPEGFDMENIPPMEPYVCCYNPDCPSQQDDREGYLVDVSMARQRMIIDGVTWVPQIVHCQKCDCYTLICKE